MPTKIVDASALAALLFNEPEADTVLAQLQEHEMAAPALLPFEVASVCLKKMRRFTRKRLQLLEAFRVYKRLEVQLMAVQPEEVLLLAEGTGLTVYDASYLWLARDLGAELVTLDRKLHHRAQELLF